MRVSGGVQLIWVQLAPVTRQSCTNKAAARQVRCCKFSRDDTVILSGGFDRRAVAWVPAAGDPHNQNQKNPQSWERAGTVYECARGITTCAISTDGMVAITGAWDGSLRLHPLEDVSAGSRPQPASYAAAGARDKPAHVSVSLSVSVSVSVCLRFNQNPPPQVPDEIHKLALSGNGLGAQVRICIHG